MWIPSLSLSTSQSITSPIMQKNVIVLIGGGHAAGKATTAELIRQEVQKLPFYSALSLQIEVVNMLDYHVQENSGNTSDEKISPNKFKPTLFDFTALIKDLKSMLLCLEHEVQKLVIVHGLYALYNKEVCDMSHMRVYIDSDADTRLIRWIRRDVLLDSKCKLEDVIGLYLNGAKQEMTNYIIPTKERADVIMPRGAESNGVSLIVDGLLPYVGFGKFLEHSLSSGLRPFQNERFDNEKGNFYELN